MVFRLTFLRLISLAVAALFSVPPILAQQTVANKPVFDSLWIEGKEHTVVELATLARSKNYFERQFAIFQLADVADQDKSAREVVLNALNDRQLVVRLAAVASLVRTGPAIDKELLKRLEKGKPIGSQGGAKTSDTPGVDDLVYAILRKKKLSTRNLVDAYSALLPRIKPAELSGKSLRGSEEANKDRNAIECVLLLIGFHVPDDPAALLPLLTSPYGIVREAAVQSLSHAQDLPDAMARAVSDVAARSQGETRLDAIAALARGRGPEALRQYGKLLAAAKESERKDAVAALDPESPIFTNALRKALGDPSADVRETAVNRAVSSGRDLVEQGPLQDTDCMKARARVRSVPLPEDIIGLILSTRNNPGESQSLEEVLPGTLNLLICEQPQRADRIVTELTADLLADDKTKKTMAHDTLEQLVEDGYGKVVGEKVLALLEQRGWKSSDEGVLAIAGLPSGSAIPQLLLKGIESENDQGRVKLISKLIESGFHASQLMATLKSLLQKGA